MTDMMAHDRFGTAQQNSLDRWGVVAERRTVPMPRSIAGSAQVLVTGAPAGDPVLVMNGIGVPGAMWASLLPHLDAHRLFVVDLPGYGLTTGTPAVGDIRRLAVDFISEISDGLGLERTAIVANSLGSLWSLWFATELPDRVTSLVHIGCPAIAVGTSAPLPMRLLSVPGLGRLLMRLDPPSPAQVRRLSTMVGEHPLPDDIAELIEATELLPEHGPTMRAMLGRLVQLRGPRPDVAFTERDAAKVTQPNLLVFARNDPMGGPDAGERLRAALPDAELYIVDGGHAPWVRHADQIGPPVAAFLARTLADAETS